jgi:hypothetical protein
LSVRVDKGERHDRAVTELRGEPAQSVEEILGLGVEHAEALELLQTLSFIWWSSHLLFSRRNRKRGSSLF